MITHSRKTRMCLAAIGFLALVCIEASAEDHSLGQVREAVRKSISLLNTASKETAQQRTCFTCHGQAMPVFVFSEAKLRGFEIDEKNMKTQLDHTLAYMTKGKANYLKGKGQGGRVDMAGYALWALDIGNRPPDETTSAVASYIAQAVNDSGYWRHTSNRPPSEASDFTTTFVALRALAAYGSEDQQPSIAEINAAAEAWLVQTKPKDTEDRVFQLRALSHLNAHQAKQVSLAQELVAMQREDGGWAQKGDMSSDAYATGLVLTGLMQTGNIEPTNDAYQRGLAYLLKEQLKDGSWKVASRSKPFQKYFETGFPHEKDQFISTTATAWATLALLFSLPEK